MKIQELSPEQKAELQKRYKEAGLKGPIHLFTVEKVEEKIKEALQTPSEPKKVEPEKVEKSKELDFSVEVFKPVIKHHEDGREYIVQMPQELKFKKADLQVEIGGKIPCGQSNQHPYNSFIIKIAGETFIMSADLASKIFEVK